MLQQAQENLAGNLEDEKETIANLVVVVHKLEATMKPIIDKHTILIFDEFIMNKNWEQDEYKALEEFCFNNDYTYEVLAISFFTKQVAVKINGI